MNAFFSKPWGGYEILEEVKGRYCVKGLTISPGERTSLQSHKGRDEHFVCVEGVGGIDIGDSTVFLKPGDTVSVPAQTKHRIWACAGFDDLTVIETQVGPHSGNEEDITRYEDDYGRV